LCFFPHAFDITDTAKNIIDKKAGMNAGSLNAEKKSFLSAGYPTGTAAAAKRTDEEEASAVFSDRPFSVTGMVCKSPQISGPAGKNSGRRINKKEALFSITLLLAGIKARFQGRRD